MWPSSVTDAYIHLLTHEESLLRHAGELCRGRFGFQESDVLLLRLPAQRFSLFALVVSPLTATCGYGERKNGAGRGKENRLRSALPKSAKKKEELKEERLRSMLPRALSRTQVMRTKDGGQGCVCVCVCVQAPIACRYVNARTHEHASANTQTGA